MTTNTITLTRTEARDTLFTLQGRTFWQDYDGVEFYEVVSEGGFTSRYTDADERPADTSHDGNGWTQTVRQYVISATPETDLRRALLDVRDRAAVLSEIDPAYLASLSPQERESRINAQVAVRRADDDGLSLTAERNDAGEWIAVPWIQSRRYAELSADADTL